MKTKLLSCVLGLLIIAAAPASEAQIAVTLGFNTCTSNGFYQSCPAYAPPVGVYFGGGTWGSDRRGNRRGVRNNHGRR